MENISNIKNSKSWQERLRDLYLYKLGLCKRCIFTATVGVILSWTLFIVLNIVFDNRLLLGLVLIVALGFSIVWLGHIVAYYFRVYRPISEARRNLDVVRADLSLSTIDSKHVTGAFKQDKLGLSFEAVISTENLFLSIGDLQGRNLLDLAEKGGIIDVSILGGRMRINFPRLTLSDAISKEERARAVKKHMSEVSISGEEDSFRDLQELPDYELLPLLSKALGTMGITGNRFPAIVSLHLLALGTFSFRQKQRRDRANANGSNDGQPDVVYAIKYPPEIRDALRPPLLTDEDDDTDPCYPPFLDDIYITDDTYQVIVGTCGTGCKGGGRRYPNRGRNCFGMCGPGCDCWWLICGDCCYHQGCADHDTACGEDDAVGCYIAAPLALIEC